MDFRDIEQLKEEGFTGFKPMKELFVDSSSIPKDKGVYMVLNLSNKKDFLTIGTGGHFNGKDPNISLAELENNWVDNTVVIYIGKAGKDGTSATLQSRLKQYFRFGQGKNVGHRGGRLIWQLKNSADLIVCWKTLPDEDPRTIEKELIKQFLERFSKRPFANLAN